MRTGLLVRGVSRRGQVRKSIQSCQKPNSKRNSNQTSKQFQRHSARLGRLSDAKIKSQTFSLQGSFQRPKRLKTARVLRYKRPRTFILFEVEKLQKLKIAIPECLILMDLEQSLTRALIKICKKFGLPVIAITDTNTDPFTINYPIPGNDLEYEYFTTFIFNTLKDVRKKEAQLIKVHKKKRET